MVNFWERYLKNRSQYYNNIFRDSYPHKDDYFRKVSLLRECSSKFLTSIFLLLFLQLLLLVFFLRFWCLLLLLYICRLILVDCMFIFFQYTLNEQLILRRKIRARKKLYIFFKMQLFISKGTREIDCHSDRGHLTKPKNKLCDSLITWSQEVRCQIESISPVLQGLWPPNLAGYDLLWQETTHGVTWLPD